MRQKRNRQRTIFEVLGKNPGPKEFEQMALVLDANPEILDLAFPDLTIHKRRQITVCIVAHMQFDRPFGFSELSPWEHFKAEVDSCCIKQI